MHKKVNIGTYTFSEDTDLTEYYECAAWSKVVRVKAGTTVPLFAYAEFRPTEYDQYERPSKGIYVPSLSTLYAIASGVIVNGTMRSRIGAHISARDDMVERYGQEDTGTKKFATYMSLGLDENDGLILPEGMVFNSSVSLLSSYESNSGDRIPTLQIERDAVLAA